MKRNSVLDLGSYSSGTLRSEDLAETFLDLAERLRVSKSDRAAVRKLRAEYDQIIRVNADETDVPFSDENLSEIVDELQELLGNYVPDYCYFGAHEGDGADFGVWIVEDLFFDTRQGSYDGMVYRAGTFPGDDPTLDAEARADDYRFWLFVNERGNCALYRKAGRRWIEVWSVV